MRFRTDRWGLYWLNRPNNRSVDTALHCRARSAVGGEGGGGSGGQLGAAGTAAPGREAAGGARCGALPRPPAHTPAPPPAARCQPGARFSPDERCRAAVGGGPVGVPAPVPTGRRGRTPGAGGGQSLGSWGRERGHGRGWERPRGPEGGGPGRPRGGAGRGGARGAGETPPRRPRPAPPGWAPPTPPRAHWPAASQ